ncbi:hypothetical protein BC835DRAFT_1289537 [Cytidiella melzeri]|nr:hypothetical protein BC835DRAFT_1289537 [Cytidiella melzeri]
MRYLENLSHRRIAAKMRRVIDNMANEGLDVASFLHYLSWNLDSKDDEEELAVDDIANTHPHQSNLAVIRYARTGFTNCSMVPEILQSLRCPPRQHDRGVQTQAARVAMDEWSISNVKMLIDRDMQSLRTMMMCKQSEVTEEYLLSIDLKESVDEARTMAPTLWEILLSAASTPRQRRTNKKKNPSKAVFITLCQLSFSRSAQRSKFQKLMSIYFKSCGVSGKAADMLYLWKICMNQKWIYGTLERIGHSNHERMLRDIHTLGLPISGSHDNLNLGFKTYEQQTDNKSHFDSGCAATIYAFSDPACVAPDAMAFQEQWRTGTQDPITSLDIFDVEVRSAKRLLQESKYIVLKILTMSTEFDFSTYTSKSHSVFAQPPPVLPLPTGPEYATRQYMLHTEHQEEASLEGNKKCMKAWYRQLKLDDPHTKRELSQKKIIPWLGDQLTVCRLRTLKKMQSWDLNWWDRMEEILELFGWFHAQIAQEQSIIKQHYGTSLGLGLKTAFDMLERKGLGAPSVQGNYHQTAHEALKHVTMAHVRDLWQVVGGVENLTELRDKCPEELDTIATRIIMEYASTHAASTLLEKKRDDQDDVLLNSVLYCRDGINYWNFDEAMQSGDVGRMEMLMPRLLYRFHGGNNWKYTIELLELFQGLLREWPADLRIFVMRYCWLANTTGRAGGFLAYDMCQEHNIRDIKYIFMVLGPFATWEYIRKISASIPTQRKVKDHIEANFNHFRRGKSHTTPDAEKDIRNLQGTYHEAEAHLYVPGRHLEVKDRTKDFIALRSDPIKLDATINRWSERRTSSRATTEDWDPEPPVRSNETEDSSNA